MKKINMSSISNKIKFIYGDECEKNTVGIVIFSNGTDYFFDEKFNNKMSNEEVEALLLRGALVFKNGKYYKPTSFDDKNVSFGGGAVVDPEDIEVDLSTYATIEYVDSNLDRMKDVIGEITSTVETVSFDTTMKSIAYTKDISIQQGDNVYFEFVSYSGAQLKNIQIFLYKDSSNYDTLKKLDNTSNFYIGDSIEFKAINDYIKVKFYVNQQEREESNVVVKFGGLEYNENGLVTRVQNLESKVGSSDGINILILGDSYSDQKKWVTQLYNYININNLINLGTTNATLKDRQADRTTYPYSDRKTSSDGTGNGTTLASQVEWLKRLIEGSDLDSGESKLTEDKYPHIVLIAGGKNDSKDNSNIKYFDVLYETITGVTTIRQNGSQLSTNKTVYKPVDVDIIDRTTFAGTLKHILYEIHTLFPNAIVLCITPSNVGYIATNPDNEKTKAAQIKEACSYLSIPVIDWYSNGMITQSFATMSGSGTDEDPYIINNSSEYTIDSLHPNDKGAKLLALEVVKQLEYYIKLIRNL